MKSKGFTLPELLGVTIILSILLIISVPIVITVINNAQKKSFENDIRAIIKTVELEYETKSLSGYPCPKNSNACNTSSNYKVLPKYNFGIDKKGNSMQTTSIFGYLKIKGDVPSGGSVFYKSSNNNNMESGYYIKLDNDSDSNLSVGVAKLVSKNGKWCADKQNNSNDIIIKKTSSDSACIQHIIVDGREIDLTAAELVYDNSVTKIKCDNVQCALDKIASMIK